MPTVRATAHHPISRLLLMGCVAVLAGCASTGDADADDPVDVQAAADAPLNPRYIPLGSGRKGLAKYGYAVEDRPGGRTRIFTVGKGVEEAHAMALLQAAELARIDGQSHFEIMNQVVGEDGGTGGRGSGGGNSPIRMTPYGGVSVSVLSLGLPKGLFSGRTRELRTEVRFLDTWDADDKLRRKPQSRIHDAVDVETRLAPVLVGKLPQGSGPDVDPDQAPLEP